MTPNPRGQGSGETSAPCEGCGKVFPAGVPVCPFCNRARPGFQPPPPDHASGSFPANSRDPDPGAILAKAQLILEHTCPKCGADLGLEPVLVEGWEDHGISFTGKQTWTVRSMSVAGYCPACSKGLFAKRLGATALLALPFWFCAFASTAWDSKGWVVPGLFLFLYCFKRLGYCWSDWLLYGMELEVHLAGRIAAVRVNSASVRFPLGWLGTTVRLIFLLVTIFLSSVLGELSRGTAGGQHLPSTNGQETHPPLQTRTGASQKLTGSGASSSTIEEAVNSADLDYLRKNLPKVRETLDKLDSKGRTLLHHASERGNPEVVALLIQSGADPNLPDRKPGNTPLHIAAIYGKTEALKKLIESGAKLDVPRKADGMTALQSAAGFDKAEAVEALIAAGADRKRPSPGGRTLLEFARKNNAQKVVMLLEKIGEN